MNMSEDDALAHAAAGKKRVDWDYMCWSFQELLKHRKSKHGEGPSFECSYWEVACCSCISEVISSPLELVFLSSLSPLQFGQVLKCIVGSKFGIGLAGEVLLC